MRLALTLLVAAGVLAAANEKPVRGTATAATDATRGAAADSLAAVRDSLMNVVLASIAGRESAPAESVFKNIKILTGVPAGRLPRIMNMGFGRSLGVGCDHCHVIGEWEKEDRPKKQVAREMFALVNTINREHLAKIRDLESKQPVVNCTTCHRGSKKPALDMTGP